MTARMSRRRRSSLLLGAAILVASASSTPSAVADEAIHTQTRHPAAGDSEGIDNRSLALTAFDFDLAGSDPLAFTVRLPDTVAASDLNELADHQLRISVHAPLDDRTELWDTVDGDPPPLLDSVVVTLDPVEPHPALIAVDGQHVTVSVARDPAGVLAESVSFTATGLLPVVVDLRRDGRTLDSLTTFVHVLRPGETIAGPAMQVAFVMTQRTEPAIDPDVLAGAAGSITADDEVLAEMTDLAAVMEAFAAAYAGTAGAPRPTVRLEPETLNAVGRTAPDADDPALADRLVAALAGSEVVAAPRLPFDPSLAAAAGRAEDHLRLLRDGESLLGALLPATPVDRSVAPMRTAPTRSGAGAMRDLGTRLFVMPYSVYDGLPGSLRFYTDTTQLVDLDLGDGTTVPAAVTDERISGLLGHDDDPVGTAMRILAELVMIADDIERSGGLIERHGMVLATSDLGVPDPRVVEHLVPVLVSTPGLRITAARELASSVDVMLVDGRQVTVGLPTQTAAMGDAVASMVARQTELEHVSAEVFAVASMVPDSTREIDEWVGIVQSLVSPVFDDVDVTTSIARVREQLDGIRTCVTAPAPFGFTLTGRNSTMRFGITNTCTMPVTVAVLLDSAKIEFPDGAQSIVLAPGGDTTVEVRARARSNGMSSVFLRLYTPADATLGIDDGTTTITPEVVLTARVTSFSGLGQLLGGAGLLVLLSWWLRHLRDARRQRSAPATTDHHPAAGASTGASAGAPAGAGRAPSRPADRTSLPGS